MNTRLLIRLKRLGTAFVTVLLVVAPLGLAFSEAPQLPAAPVRPALPTTPTTTPKVIVAPTAPETPVSPTAPALPGSEETNSGTTGDTQGTSNPTENTAPTADTGSSTANPSESCPLNEEVAGDLGAESGQTIPTLAEGSGSESTESGVSNENTGAGSVNEAVVLDASKLVVNNDNQAEVNNGLVVSSNTGDNDANYNTGSGSVKTGDSNIILSILNMINTAFVALPGGEIKLLFENVAGNLFGNYLVDPNSGEKYTLTGSRVGAENENTGAESTNSAIINTNNSTFVNNDNDANASNNFNIESNTGDNDASYNTGDGNVTTGDSNVSLNLLNFINSSFTASDLGVVGVLNIFGDWLGDLLIPKSLAGNSINSNNSGGAITAGNENTGFDSSNISSANVNNALDIDNDNNAEVLNNIKIANNTGDNTSGYNTGSGSVQTGDVNTELSVSNLLNQNLIGDTIFFFIVNVAGQWSGENLLSPYLGIVNNGCDSENVCNLAASNENTGAESENTATVDASSLIDIDNENEGVLSNNISITANTGDNKADYNTGNGNITTGDSNVLANIANIMNVNVVAKKFVFLVVNIFGDWDGNIDVEKEVAQTTATTQVITQIPTEIHISTEPVDSSVFKIFTSAGVKVPVDGSIALENILPDNDNNAVLLASSNSNQDGGSSVLGVNTISQTNDSNNFLSMLGKFKMQILAFLTIVYLSFLSVYFGKKKKSGA